MTRIFSRRSLKRLAGAVIGMLFFTQFAMAVQVCTMPQPNPAQAIGGAVAMGECEGMPSGSAACLADCLKTDQISYSLAFHLDEVPPPASSLAKLFIPEQMEWAANPTPGPQCHPGGPSLQILFCSFQS